MPTSASRPRATSKASAWPANSSGSATFSSAVIVGTRWKDWKTMPILRPRTSASASSLRLAKSCPATRTPPEVARSRPAMIINSEVLPEPLGPTMATDSPGAMLTSTPRRISTGPARLASVNETLSREIAGSATSARLLQGFRPCNGPEALPQALQVSTSMLRATVPARDPMLTMPFSKRQANMVLAILLCNWLLLVAATAAHAAAAGQPLRIVVFGDSLVAGFQLKAADAFPAQLERALKARGHSVEVINAGVSGDTTAAGLERLRWSIPDKVDAVILELGANDALRGLDPNRAKSNLDKMITAIKGSGAEVLLAGMLAPPNMGPQYAQAFNGIYQDLAAKHG